MQRSITSWLPCRLSEDEFIVLAAALRSPNTPAANNLLAKLIACRQPLAELMTGPSWTPPPEPLEDLPL